MSLFGDRERFKGAQTRRSRSAVQLAVLLARDGQSTLLIETRDGFRVVLDGALQADQGNLQIVGRLAGGALVLAREIPARRRSVTVVTVRQKNKVTVVNS